jgi:hypothetical protein
MTKIINSTGKEIDFDAAALLMDQEISASFEHGDGLTEQEFFDVYCLEHRKKFGEEFEPNKPHPVW